MAVPPVSTPLPFGVALSTQPSLSNESLLQGVDSFELQASGFGAGIVLSKNISLSRTGLKKKRLTREDQVKCAPSAISIA